MPEAETHRLPSVAGALVSGASSRGGAVFDASGVYRYGLWREWDAARPAVAFVMLNPSTADGERNDPTIRRCLGFARSWGFGRLEVVNLFALRATNPAQLAQHPEPIGPENDDHIRAAISTATTVVAAWGTHGELGGRDTAVSRLLPSSACDLGRTRAGHPRHPLYVRADVRLQAART